MIKYQYFNQTLYLTTSNNLSSLHQTFTLISLQQYLIRQQVLIKMKLNNFNRDLEMESQSNRSITLFDSPRRQDHKNQSFFSKFKHNQGELRNKFKQYIKTQKLKYPLASKHIKTDSFSDQEEDYQEVDFRAVRQQKKRMTQQLQATLNQTKYMQKKKADKEKTFNLLKQKWKRVTNIRKQRKIEVKLIQNTIKQISSEIRQEKLKYRKSIEESRFNLTRSRLACENQKYQSAEKTRLQTEQHMKILSEQKEQQWQRKKVRCETVREKERTTQLTVSQVKHTKKEQAEEVKLERLLRELAEKQEIKLASSRAKQEFHTRYGKTDNKNEVLYLKIKEFRRSLGQRRASPEPKICLKLSCKLDRQQQIQRSSTNSGFPFKSKRRSFTEQVQTQN